MKDPKHFVKQARIDASGRVIQAVVLTPPLDTPEQANQYLVWYEKEGNHVRIAVEDKMTSSWVTEEQTTFVVMAIETTLY